VPRILVVDDSSAFEAFARAALEPAAASPGDEIVVAESGVDALQRLTRGGFDLVVVDVNMPDIHGLELLRFLRSSERHARTPVLVVSTQGGLLLRKRALASGATRFLPKPFTEAELRRAVAACLAAPAAERA
jgi:two-component system chemotaxis response regulator CheY